MLRKVIHVQVNKKHSSDAERLCIPCHLLVKSAFQSWYQANETKILEELCEAIGDNYEALATATAPQDSSEYPPQIFGSTIRVAYISRPLEGASYKMLGSTNDLADSFQKVPMSSFLLDPVWIFPLEDDNLGRHDPLPI